MAGLTTGNGLPDVVVTGFRHDDCVWRPTPRRTWKALLDGQSGIRTLEDPFVEEYDLPVRIGGHLLEDFDGELTRVELRRLSYLQKMSTVLGRRAWENAGSPEVDTKRLMVSIGTGMGSRRGTGLRLRRHAGEGPARRCRRWPCRCTCPTRPRPRSGWSAAPRPGSSRRSRPARRVRRASRNAWRNIVLGEADIAICGGVETRIEAVPIAGFAQMRIVLSTTNDDPAGACRPFDRDRNGFVFGEGGALHGHRDRGARQGARRQHPRPADGRQRHLGRLPHRGARPQRRAGRARDDAGHPARRARPH